jgi:2-keto-4-pentenoate hydratase
MSAEETPEKKTEERPAEIGIRGRYLYGETPPGGAKPWPRSSPLSDAEVDQVVALIANGRRQRVPVELPETLRSRDWASVERVLLKLDKSLGRTGKGWKIGAASQEIRQAEGLPSPSPGRIYEGTIFPSGSTLGPELFVNYRNCECEFAFQLGMDFPVRDQAYTEADARAGIETLFPALEIGDTVFLDWYGASGYFGSCLDNGGGAAFVEGTKIADWQEVDLVQGGMDVYLNGWYVKSGKGVLAMGHPVTSLTWMLNWAREHGRPIAASEVISTGTCTGHLFAAPGDLVMADFGQLGTVNVKFA